MQKGLIKNLKNGVKVLGMGELKAKLTVRAAPRWKPSTEGSSRNGSRSCAARGPRICGIIRANSFRCRRTVFEWNHPISAKLNAGVESEILKQVATVPKPKQLPYPPLFTTLSQSPETINWSARIGASVVTLAATCAQPS